MLLPETDNCHSRISGRRNESILPDGVSKPGPLSLESDALPTTLHGPAFILFVQKILYLLGIVFTILGSCL